MAAIVVLYVFLRPISSFTTLYSVLLLSLSLFPSLRLNTSTVNYGLVSFSSFKMLEVTLQL